MTPKITVLMPVYNAEKHLGEAMDSIWAQTWTDFEFLVIDDGSTDGSAAIIEADTDPRLRLVRNERNLGLTATLNNGLNLARGEYIARMDADDISLPERFARQVTFLDTHPSVGIVGVWATAFGDARFQIPHPAEPEHIRAKLLFDSALVHPAVMMRRDFLYTHALRYLDFPGMEDYELWQRAALAFPLANIPEYLFRYRVSGGSIFFGGNADARREVYAQIDRQTLPRLGIAPTPAEIDLHTYLRRPEGDRRSEAEAWLLKLAGANRRITYYDPEAFAAMLHERWLVANYLAPGPALARWRRYARSPITRAARLPPPMQARMLAKFLVQPLREARKQ